ERDSDVEPPAEHVHRPAVLHPGARNDHHRCRGRVPHVEHATGGPSGDTGGDDGQRYQGGSGRGSNDPERRKHGTQATATMGTWTPSKPSAKSRSGSNANTPTPTACRPTGALPKRWPMCPTSDATCCAAPM